MPNHSPLRLQVRAAGPEDAELLAELGERTFRETYAGLTRPEDVEALVADRYRADLVRAVMAEPGSCFLLGEVDGAAAGFALLRDTVPDEGAALPGDRPVALEQLYVERRFHGRGVGPALLEHCRTVAGGRGHNVVWLSVWEHNLRAIAFYRRSGFAVAGELTFILGGDPQRDLLMVLPL